MSKTKDQQIKEEENNKSAEEIEREITEVNTTYDALYERYVNNPPPKQGWRAKSRGWSYSPTTREREIFDAYGQYPAGSEPWKKTRYL